MSMWARLLHTVQRFRRDHQGVAAVEFALVLPIMLVMYIGSVEASTVITLDRRVQTIAGTMGDLVSRSNLKIAACDIQRYFQASVGIMAPYPTTALQQIVTAVFVNPDGSTVVKWSTPAGGATAHAVGSSYTLPAAMKNIALNNYVIVAEASYTYSPITNLIYHATIPLYRENFYMLRFGGTLSVDPPTATNC